MRVTLLAIVGMLVVAGCSSGPTAADATATTPSAMTSPAASTPDPGSTRSDGLYPDVVAASATMDGPGTWQFTATLSSPYDSPDRYADAWRVLAPDGTELGIRVLAHDHAGEQPFTRSLGGVAVPGGIDVVTVQGRDQVNGWGGATAEVVLQR